MNSRLLTFEDIRDRLEDDLIGGTIEISEPTLHLRGMLDDIIWAHHSPKQINWTNGQSWLMEKSKWVFSKNSNFIFLESIEYFTGPFETTSDIVMFISRRKFVTIFPQKVKPYSAPIRVEEYKKLAAAHFKPYSPTYLST